MLSNLLLAAVSAVSTLADDNGASERVLGAFVFHRHGDRTAKVWKPVNLTALGANQVHDSGAFYRARYLSGSGADSGFRIAGLSADDPGQLAVSAPDDAVLHASAVFFLQGLYPPARRPETLTNGSRIVTPLNGYQYVPVGGVHAVAAVAADHHEDKAWLQGGTGCSNAEVSSNSYVASPEYRAVSDDSAAFYRSLLPVINGSYPEAEANFKNGYSSAAPLPLRSMSAATDPTESVFDLINVATIHNASIPSSSLLTPATLARLYSLASVREWNLAFNASEPVRAIAGAVLAAEVVDALQAFVDARPAARPLSVQFGAYGTFMAFFGLAQLPAASPVFYRICNYASSMVFELLTTAPPDARPGPNDVSVRFLFANGSAPDAGLRRFPLFGQDKLTLPWADFKAGMAKFAVADTRHWCDLCGSTDGKCASSKGSTAGSDGDSSRSSAGSGSAISKPVVGAIGALVTLVVVLGLQAAVMLFGGLRLVSKSTLAGVRRAAQASEAGGVKA